jgi:hypothetical protein
MFNSLEKAINKSNDEQSAIKAEASIFNDEEDGIFDVISEAFGDVDPSDEDELSESDNDKDGIKRYVAINDEAKEKQKALDLRIHEKMKKPGISEEEKNAIKKEEEEASKHIELERQRKIKELKDSIPPSKKLESSSLLEEEEVASAEVTECSEEEDFNSPTEDIFGRSDNDGFDSKLPDAHISADLPVGTIKPEFPVDVPDDSVLLNDEDFSKDLENGMFECATCNMSEDSDEEDSDEEDSDEEDSDDIDYSNLPDPDDFDDSDLDDSDDLNSPYDGGDTDDDQEDED